MPDTPLQERMHERLRQRWAELEFEGLSRPEQEAVALFWLESEVMNGGLIQFFTNSAGDLALHAASGLKRLGCLRSLEALNSAIEKLSLGDGLLSRDDRLDALAPYLESEVDPFESETEILQGMPEEFFRLALDDLVPLYERGHV